MSRDEGKNDDLDALEEADQEASSEQSDLEPLASDLDQLDAGQAETEPAEEEPVAESQEAAEQPEDAEAEALEKPAQAPVEPGRSGPSKTPMIMESAGVIGLPVILLALAFFQVISFPTAIYVVCVGFIPYGIWKSGVSQSVYTILLACALAAILTAIYFLCLELRRYEYNSKPSQFGRASSTIDGAYSSRSA